MTHQLLSYLVRFLSTPSARRATADADLADLIFLDISIHALREEGDVRVDDIRVIADTISIHALREEGDDLDDLSAGQNRLFLSTPSARRATNQLPSGLLLRLISIHALREEGDTTRM